MDDSDHEIFASRTRSCLGGEFFVVPRLGRAVFMAALGHDIHIREKGFS
jgi:hypothetical protein